MLIQGKLTVTRDAILRQFLEKSVGIIKACTPALPSTKRWPNGVVLSTLCPPSWLSWLLNTSVTGTVTYFLSCCPIGQCIGVQMLHTGCSHIWLGTLNAGGVCVWAPLEQEIPAVSKYGLLVAVMRQVVIQVIMINRPAYNVHNDDNDFVPGEQVWA